MVLPSCPAQESVLRCRVLLGALVLKRREEMSKTLYAWLAVNSSLLREKGTLMRGDDSWFWGDIYHFSSRRSCAKFLRWIPCFFASVQICMFNCFKQITRGRERGTEREKEQGSDWTMTNVIADNCHYLCTDRKCWLCNAFFMEPCFGPPHSQASKSSFIAPSILTFGWIAAHTKHVLEQLLI